jgi:hypothetical protein
LEAVQEVQHSGKGRTNYKIAEEKTKAEQLLVVQGAHHSRKSRRNHGMWQSQYLPLVSELILPPVEKVYYVARRNFSHQVAMWMQRYEGVVVMIQC